MRILVVEDQRKIAAGIAHGLKLAGIATILAADGESGLQLALDEFFDAIILDIMLPRRDGLAVLRSLRQAQKTTPVLLLSARGEVEDRIRGLDQGADDYLPKPFVTAELISRVKALGRRGVPLEATRLQVADLTMDLLRREIRRGGVRLELSPREQRLLEYLARAQGRVCPRSELYARVWDYREGYDPGTNAVQVAMKRLREKIDGPFELKLVQTIVSEGYALRAGE